MFPINISLPSYSWHLSFYNIFLNNKKPTNVDVYGLLPTPRVGLEPTTPRLTAACSTIELSRITLILLLSLLRDTPSKPNLNLYLISIFPDSCVSSLLLSLELISQKSAPWLSPRPISTCQLSTLLHSHLMPIYLVLSKGSYRSPYGISHLEGGFTLRCLQRLSLPDLATLPWHWMPTGTPAVRPSRSSRTKDSSSQISYACAG